MQEFKKYAFFLFAVVVIKIAIGLVIDDLRNTRIVSFHGDINDSIRFEKR